MWRSILHCRILALAWTSPNFCWHLGSELAGGRFCCSIFVSLCVSNKCIYTHLYMKIRSTKQEGEIVTLSRVEHQSKIHCCNWPVVKGWLGHSERLQKCDPFLTSQGKSIPTFTVFSIVLLTTGYYYQCNIFLTKFNQEVHTAAQQVKLALVTWASHIKSLLLCI